MAWLKRKKSKAKEADSAKPEATPKKTSDETATKKKGSLLGFLNRKDKKKKETVESSPAASEVQATAAEPATPAAAKSKKSKSFLGFLKFGGKKKSGADQSPEKAAPESSETPVGSKPSVSFQDPFVHGAIAGTVFIAMIGLFIASFASPDSSLVLLGLLALSFIGLGTAVLQAMFGAKEIWGLTAIIAASGFMQFGIIASVSEATTPLPGTWEWLFLGIALLAYLIHEPDGGLLSAKFGSCLTAGKAALILSIFVLFTGMVAGVKSIEGGSFNLTSPFSMAFGGTFMLMLLCYVMNMQARKRELQFQTAGAAVAAPAKQNKKGAKKKKSAAKSDKPGFFGKLFKRKKSKNEAVKSEATTAVAESTGDLVGADMVQGAELVADEPTPSPDDTSADSLADLDLGEDSNLGGGLMSTAQLKSIQEEANK